VTINHIRQLHEQGSPILLLAQLHRELKHLPSATFGIDTHIPGQLDISLHPASNEMPAMEAFEVWRTALGLDKPHMLRSGALAWLTAEGDVHDVPVKLTAFGTQDEVTTAASAVGVEAPASWSENAATVVPA
jgi:hypothetical protein